MSAMQPVPRDVRYRTRGFLMRLNNTRPSEQVRAERRSTEDGIRCVRFQPQNESSEQYMSPSAYHMYRGTYVIAIN